MFEVIVGNSLSKRLETEAKADAFILAVQKLFGADTMILKNEVKTLFDEMAKPVSSMTLRVKEYPVKEVIA